MISSFYRSQNMLSSGMNPSVTNTASNLDYATHRNKLFSLMRAPSTVVQSSVAEPGHFQVELLLERLSSYVDNGEPDFMRYLAMRSYVMQIFTSTSPISLGNDIRQNRREFIYHDPFHRLLAWIVERDESFSSPQLNYHHGQCQDPPGSLYPPNDRGKVRCVSIFIYS